MHCSRSFAFIFAVFRHFANIFILSSGHEAGMEPIPKSTEMVCLDGHIRVFALTIGELRSEPSVGRLF